MSEAVMRVKQQFVPYTVPGQEDYLVNDPDTNPHFDISRTHFRKQKAELLKWGLSQCSQFKEIDRLAQVARNQKCFHQVKTHVGSANRRVLRMYRRRSFTNGTQTVIPNGVSVILFCEQSDDWQLVR
jgi:hypothetical protein